MSCYLHNLDEVFAAAGISPTKENKKQLDALLHHLTGQKNKNCPLTWKQIKSWLSDAEKKQELIENLKKEWQGDR